MGGARFWAVSNRRDHGAVSTELDILAGTVTAAALTYGLGYGTHLACASFAALACATAGTVLALSTAAGVYGTGMLAYEAYSSIDERW